MCGINKQTSISNDSCFHTVVEGGICVEQQTGWWNMEHMGEYGRTHRQKPYSPPHKHSHMIRLDAPGFRSALQCVHSLQPELPWSHLRPLGATVTQTNDTLEKHKCELCPSLLRLQLGAAQAPEPLQGDWRGWAGSVHWESPSSTLPPCLLMAHCSLMAADPTLFSSSGAKGSCCKQHSTETQHTLPRQELTYSLHLMDRGCYLELCRELAAGAMHRGICPHPGPSCRFPFPSAPAKGLVQSCPARHKLTTSQAEKQESVWQLDKMYPRSCRKPIDQD